MLAFLTVFRFDGGTKVHLSSLSKIVGETVELEDGVSTPVIFAPCPTSQYGGFPVVSTVCT